MIARYMRRSLHASWQVLAASAGVLLGVALAPHIAIHIVGIAWLLTGMTFVLFAITRQTVWVIPLACIGGLLIGGWRSGGELEAQQVYMPLYGSVGEIKGTITEDVATNDRGQAVLRLKDIVVEQQQTSGVLWVTTKHDERLQRSDQVTIRGKLQPGFGTFVGAVYGADIVKLERPKPGDVALKIRNWFAGAIRLAIPEPQASLGIGYLVGQRRDLPEQLDESLRIAGLTHVVVASGYNLTILVRLARRLFAKVSKFLSAFASSGLLVSFIAITGASPSMSRAGLVTGLSLMAWYYGRTFHPLILLMLAAAIAVLINPSYAWGDVGWQLSFAAFAGVMLLAPVLQAYYFGETKPGIMRQILGETFSAWVCTLPILMYTFGQLSTVAIVANMLVLPLVPLAMLLTFIVGISVLALPILAGLLSWLTLSLLTYMTSVAEYLAALPWALVDAKITMWHVAVMYAVIVCAGIYMKSQTKINLKQTSVIE